MPSARPRMAAEAGFTLVELLVAVTLMGVILTASLAALLSAERGQREVGSRTDELAQSRQSVERLTRELRAARSVLSITPSTLAIDTLTYTPGTRVPQYRIVDYACAATSCTRAVSGGTPIRALGNVTNAAAVFSGVANENGAVNYVAVTVTMRTLGTNRAPGSITLSDGVNLRNLR